MPFQPVNDQELYIAGRFERGSSLPSMVLYCTVQRIAVSGEYFEKWHAG